MPAATLNADITKYIRPLLREAAEGQRVRVSQVTLTRLHNECQTEINLCLFVDDIDLHDIIGDVKEDIETDIMDEETKTVDRPSSHSITTVGACNLTVKWDKEYGLFRLESVCPSCSRRFESTLRGFATKDLVVAAHELGFTLGQHLEHHQTFGDYLKKLQGESE